MKLHDLSLKLKRLDHLLDTQDVRPLTDKEVDELRTLHEIDVMILKKPFCGRLLPSDYVGGRNKLPSDREG